MIHYLPSPLSQLATEGCGRSDEVLEEAPNSWIWRDYAGPWNLGFVEPLLASVAVAVGLSYNV
jgi:hypothetical protein